MYFECGLNLLTLTRILPNGNLFTSVVVDMK